MCILCIVHSIILDAVRFAKFFQTDGMREKCRNLYGIEQYSLTEKADDNEDLEAPSQESIAKALAVTLIGQHPELYRYY